MNGGKGPGDPKIGDFEAHIRCDQHVLRFHIAVDQPGPVGVANSSTGLDEQRQGLFRAEPAALLDQRFQVRARDVFHDQE